MQSALKYEMSFEVDRDVLLSYRLRCLIANAVRPEAIHGKFSCFMVCDTLLYRPLAVRAAECHDHADFVQKVVPRTVKRLTVAMIREDYLERLLGLSETEMDFASSLHYALRSPHCVSCLIVLGRMSLQDQLAC